MIVYINLYNIYIYSINNIKIIGDNCAIIIVIYMLYTVTSKMNSRQFYLNLTSSRGI